MRYCLDIPSTATTMPFNSQPEVMAAFYGTHLECTAWRGRNGASSPDVLIAEKYFVEGEDGDLIMHEEIIEDAEYVEL